MIVHWLACPAQGAHEILTISNKGNSFWRTWPSRVVAIQTGGYCEYQLARFNGEKDLFCNAHMEPRHLRSHCDLGSDSQELLRNATEKLGFSARAYDRILKVGRTMADLTGEERIGSSHIAEAIQYRSLDRGNRVGV